MSQYVAKHLVDVSDVYVLIKNSGYLFQLFQSRSSQRNTFYHKKPNLIQSQTYKGHNPPRKAWFQKEG